MAERARAPALVRSSAECVGATGIEGELEPLLVSAVRETDPGLLVHVRFPCVTVRAEPQRVLAVVVSGHGGLAHVLGIERADGDGFRMRSLRVASGGGPDGAAAGPVEASGGTLPGAAVRSVFDRLRTALAAQVTSERHAPASRRDVELGPIGIGSDQRSLELTLTDARSALAARAWQGRGGTIGAEERVVLELAWQELAGATSERSARVDPGAEHRALLADAWLSNVGGFVRPWYVTRALLVLAAHVGSPDLVPSLVEQLGPAAARAVAGPSANAEAQRLAVDALASITGQDLRLDGNGNARPLADVVADYRRECGAAAER
jgi:hypothetical protein